jgi:hypothetical protein
MAKAGYSAITGADVALAAATAKSILGLKSGAAFGIDLIGVSCAFDQSGAGASTNEPVLVEVCYCTFATNSPGTASTTVTPLQKYGRVLAHGTTAARTWTTEPTALTVIDEFLVHPQSGFKEWIPLGNSPDCAFAEGFVIRCTAPNIVNARAVMNFERM